MHLLREVKAAEYLEAYRLLITFDNGTQKVVDLEHHLTGEIFEPLKDESFFRRFKVNHDTDTLEWENEADFSPDFLYEIGKEVPVANAV